MAEQAQLRDILNYDPERYITEEDVSIIRSTFKDNPRLIAVLRKVLIPTTADPNLPIEEFGKDMWTVGRDYSQIPNDEIKTIVLARQEAIKFVFGGLISLKQLANLPDESPYSKDLKKQKDSNK